MALQLLNNCDFDNKSIKTLWIGSRLVDGGAIQYPIEYQTVSGSSDSIVAITAWDRNADLVTIGDQQIFVNKIINTGDNIGFDEAYVVNRNGKVYRKTITFVIPKITLFLVNQLKEFTTTASGLAQLSPTIAFLEDSNNQTLVVGYDKALYVDTTTFAIGDTNEVALSYVSTSYSRARQYQIL